MKLLEKNVELCVGCHACEAVCANTYFKEKNYEKSCIKIQEKTEEVFDITVCNQCGVCIDICPVEALYRDKKGVVRMKKDLCVGCFMCVGFCPEEAMMQHDELIEPFKCVACGLCSKECPNNAIFIVEKDTMSVDIDTIQETASSMEE